MAGYRLLVKPSTVKEIEAIDTKRDRQRIVSRLQSLAADPRPASCEKLAGPVNWFRVRLGENRVVYLVDDAERIIKVIKVSHRREIFRSL